MEDRRAVLTDRITFAEDWLARARRQVQDGHRTRGVLTLMLAEAEVHRARELGMHGAGSPSPRRAWLRVAALVAAVGGVAVGVWHPFAPGGPAGPLALRDAAAHETSSPPVVVLEGGTGALLRLVQAPDAPVERTVTVPVLVRAAITQPAALLEPAAPAAPAAQLASAPPAAVTQAAPRRPDARPVTVAPPSAVTEAPVLLSEAELIDLVLAAERSLRRSANQ